MMTRLFHFFVEHIDLIAEALGLSSDKSEITLPWF